MIKGLLFDKDGTLIEFQRMWHGIMTKVFHRYRLELGLEEGTIDLLKREAGYLPDGFRRESMVQHMTIPLIVDKWLRLYSAESGKGEELRRGMIGIFESVALDRDLQRSPLPGVRRTLSLLSQQSYHLGVATADTPASTRLSLQQTGLSEYFSFIASDDGSFRPKPDPHMAEDFCRDCRISADELLVVGDSLGDYTFARNAGARFVGLATSYNEFEVGQSLDALFTDSFEEIIPALGLWN